LHTIIKDLLGKAKWPLIIAEGLSKFNTEEDSASEASTGSLGFQETGSLGFQETGSLGFQETGSLGSTS
jgi:hypothetical protein